MSTFPPPTTAPAGWYPDPEGLPGRRYFDGRSWAERYDHLQPRLAPSRPPRAPHPTLPFGAAWGALGILLVSLVGGRFLIDALTVHRWPVVLYVVILATIGYGPSLWWCWYVSRRWGTGRLADDIGFRARWSDLGWGPLVWVGTVTTQIAVAVVVLVTRIPSGGNVDGITDLRNDRTYVVVILFTAVVAAPFVEEMVFRGVVLRGFLARMGAPLAIVAQGVLFGVVHVDPVRGVANFGLAIVLSGVGVALGVAAYLFRRIGPTIIAHAIFNGVVLTLLLTGVAERLQDDAAVAPSTSWGESHVVDQSDLAEPHGNDHERVAIESVDPLERRRVDHGDVVESGTRLGTDDRADERLDRVR